IYPGVTVLGLSVGRATRAEAEMALRAYVHNVRQQPLRVRVPDEVPPITLMALGLDAADGEILRLVDDAWWVGRDLPLGNWLMSQFRLLTRGYAVPGALTLDSEQAREVLQQLAEQLSREPVSATLRVTNSDAGFVSLIERSQPGRRLKVEETLLRLQRSLAGQLPSTLDLVLEELPVRVTEADLERPRAAVDHLLQSPLVLRAGDKTWDLEPDVLFSMLDTEALATEQAAPVARLREAKVRAFVASVAADANDPPGTPSLELTDSAIALQPGRAGAALDEPAAVRLIMGQALTEQRLLTLPMMTVQATLSEAALDLLLRQAGQRLTQPLVLRHASREWVLEGQALLDLVVLQPIESAMAPIAPATLPDLEVALDRAQVEAFIGAEVAAPVAVRVELARFALRDGRTEVSGGSSGLMPDGPATYDALAAAFVSQDREARVGGVQVRPAHPAEIAVLLEP
ncbi:MAG: peptidoglycan binding domain-containing protein, partial [Chloroflexota bacterium]|nr:peptidoglycan binding domain-containing protein [Chloroflexota bacterium]